MSKTTNWNSLKKHRVLVMPGPASDRPGGPFEYTVEEISPSGMVKFRNAGGRTFWCPGDEYVLADDLGYYGPEKPAPKKPE